MSGRLDEVLTTPLESIKKEQVEKAEAALLSIKKLLDRGQSANDGEFLHTQFAIVKIMSIIKFLQKYVR